MLHTHTHTPTHTPAHSTHTGLQNPEEFSFTSDEETSEQTLRREGHKARDQKRLDKLKMKLHTDDECTCRIKGAWP